MSYDPSTLISDFIRKNFAVDEESELTAETPLLSDGWLDSLAVSMLATFIEETFGVRFDDVDIRRGSGESIREIVELVAKRRR